MFGRCIGRVGYSEPEEGPAGGSSYLLLRFLGCMLSWKIGLVCVRRVKIELLNLNHRYPYYTSLKIGTVECMQLSSLDLSRYRHELHITPRASEAIEGDTDNQ